MTKKELAETIIPDRCKGCEYLCLSMASGLTRTLRHPIATCKLNHAGNTKDDLRGTYTPCVDVILLYPLYKCSYDKERTA